jgi:thiol-disulfide isomerase/thioredoxin
MKRRQAVLTGGLAVAAASTGWGLWRWRDGDQVAPATFWDLTLDRPEGGHLQMASFRGRPLVLNFWATWCAPCIREMPALDRFQREFGPNGWQVVGIAADSEAPVRDFLRRMPVAFPVGLAGFNGIDLARSLGNLAGGLPFTVVFTSDGHIARRHAGETRFDDLAAWAKGIR